MKSFSTYLLLFGCFILLSQTSCSLALPSFRKTSQNSQISINNASAQIEPLKRGEYDVLTTTSGKASSSQFYLLFFPIGRHKSSDDLYENAYYEAVNNLPNADGLILPRQKNKRLFIPLLLVNYSRRAVEVSGLGVSVKGKTK